MTPEDIRESTASRWARCSSTCAWVRRVYELGLLGPGRMRERQPVIAVVQGPALGGGFELAMAADLRVASEEARFGLPETAIATCPGWSGSQRLSRLINPSLIKELVFTGRTLGSHRAFVLGLVNEVCAEPLDAARSMAESIAARAPVSVQLSKQMIDAGNGDNSAMIIEAMAGGLAEIDGSGTVLRNFRYDPANPGSIAANGVMSLALVSIKSTSITSSKKSMPSMSRSQSGPGGMGCLFVCIPSPNASS